MAVDDHETEKTPSAKIVGSIDDLLIEIFLRLPMKSLIRFKSVSKHWHSVISDPGFCILRNRNPNPAVGLIFRNPKMTDKYYAYVFPFNKSPTTPPSSMYSVFMKYYCIIIKKKPTSCPPFRKLKFTRPRRPRFIRILNSCNGLLVCKSSEARYYVCNPTTNQYSILPETVGEGGRIRGTCLAFDPSKSPHYKVVCAREFKPEFVNYPYRYQFEVYSSETGSWRKCSKFFTTCVIFEKGGVYWNGSNHWINFRNPGKSLYFNPDDDQMPHVMPTTPPISGHYYFGESSGHLHCVGYNSTTGCTVYEMKKDYSEWFVKYNVDLSGVVDHWFSICALVRCKKDEDSFLVLWEKKRIIRYNLVCKTFEDLHEFAYPCVEAPLSYIECLCSV